MHEKTAEGMIQRYEKALTIRREFEELYDEIFEYCLPQRQGFKNYTPGQGEMIRSLMRLQLLVYKNLHQDVNQD